MRPRYTLKVDVPAGTVVIVVMLPGITSAANIDVEPSTEGLQLAAGVEHVHSCLIIHFDVRDEISPVCAPRAARVKPILKIARACT